MRAFFRLAVAFLSLAVSAQAETLSTFHLTRTDSTTLRDVSRLFEIVKEEGELRAIVPSSQVDLFQAVAPGAVLRDADMEATLRAQVQSYGLTAAENRYHNFDEVLAWMSGIAAARPELAEVISYGLSAGSRPLQALRLRKSEGKPALLITAATHGDEVITTEVLMELVNTMLAGYGTDPRFTAMIDNHDLYFVPVLNPDGFTRMARYDTGRDPNRSYPYPEQPTANPTASIQGIMKLFHSRAFAGTLDFHAFGEMIMYPWAYTYDSIDPAHKEAFHRLTGSMAERNRYDFGPISDVIYVAKGSSADYYFWKTQSTSLAVEMGRSKAPNPRNFPEYVDAQAEALWRFIESF